MEYRFSKYTFVHSNYKIGNMGKTIHSSEYRLMINLLRSKRENANITQKQLSEKLNLKQAMISKIETCERRIDVIELRHYCNAIEISYVEFIIELNKILSND